MFFKRKKSVEQPVEEPTVEESTPEPTPTSGPFDISDVPETDSYLDFGSILVKPIPGMKVRMDIEQANQRVVAVSLEIAESRVQLMAFASSKSASLWPGIREKITGDIHGQKGEIFTREGEYGEELLAKVPQQLPDGRAGHVALRFVGVDGPRWFLRAVVGGAAIADEEATQIVDELLRSVVINRGDKPLPPAELLPLNVPSNASTRVETPEPEITRPERGPEITQIG
ncbi:hypothetical protein CQ010_03085 [Arthrobacter sp. MYb211]|uniref:DUF3710 domain-containing protein n=1 Tax=Micrococcaceae TaxID=1268 RepID=UPI000CFD9D0A|nr:MULTISPECIES: DUF3710 domain-containing protein [unclassified Arthrobacter]PRA01431.1 hypothetical protein CQ017_02795 [Arthrobacter sp. MYb224]PRA06377.1 hypothetical protein CQ019_02985 [Arthrobacter sp. MYb229]PRA12686.1 hypothetical protein CQ015_05445 [Arthrobacter sp. MYb221]PRB53279.1 hypothetical protein CQ013_02985 [Arthrobacter sp. MYb216]PRC09793.1 hypothetical protein CQ010_03085 [Arthrobacter sp. MYb211]